MLLIIRQKTSQYISHSCKFNGDKATNAQKFLLKQTYAEPIYSNSLLAMTMWQEPLRIGADIQPVGVSNVCSRNFRTSLEMNHHLLRRARHITASGKLFVSVNVYNVSDGAHDKFRNQRLAKQHMRRLLKPQSLILDMSNTSTSKSMS